MGKRITINLSDREIEILEYIQNQEGQVNIPAVVHDCIVEHYRRQYYSKHIKGNVIKTLVEENLTVEQLCEKKGGRVSIHEGIPVCAFKLSESMTQYIHLSMPQKIEAFTQ